jgi:hypothetical protein
MRLTMVKRRPKSSPKKGPRRSARAIAEHADRILLEARLRDQEYARLGLRTETISRADLIAGLSGTSAHSPFITQIGMSGAVRGATFLINFVIMQPDSSIVYSENNLGLCYCWSDAGGLLDPGQNLLVAEPSVGVIQIDIGTLNATPMPYTFSSTHLIPSSFRLGPADLNYFLYMPDPWGPAVLLKRGTMRVVVS